MKRKEQLVLVNENDKAIGVGEKIHTHVIGALHRAFSVFIFNSAGQLLLQRRSSTKYHSPGLWSNTCCGHPRPDETIVQASRRRLNEEMGFDCAVSKVFEFIYHAKLDNGMCEHEYDHVLVGSFDQSPKPNRDEVDDWKWVDPTTIEVDMLAHPENYTYWFKLSLTRIFDFIPQVTTLNMDKIGECNTMRSS